MLNLADMIDFESVRDFYLPAVWIKNRIELPEHK